jgi:di/tricarboxylate transporter
VSSDQIILFALFGCVFGLLLWGRIRYDLVAFAALLVGVVLGVVPSAEAFAGFGHPAVIIVALVLIVSAGLVRSGAVLLITRNLVNPKRGLQSHIALMGGLGGVMSAFMNNVAALALLMPVDIATARKAGRAAALTLMPLSFATILGGMVTLIGTPPNIIVASIREESLGAPFAMFDYAPVGGVAALVGLAFVALVGWRLIPGGQEDSGTVPDRALSDYLAELSVTSKATILGQSLRDLEEEAAKSDVTLIALSRGGRRRRSRKLALEAGDTLVLEGTPAAIDEFRASARLSVVPTSRPEIADSETILVEMVVTEGSRLVGRSTRAVGLSWRQETLLLGIARQGRRITQKLSETPLRAGDVLLLLMPAGREAEVVQWLGGLPLAERGLGQTREGHTWLAVALFAAAVGAAALGLVALPVALGLTVVGYLLSGILPLRDIYDHIEWPVIVLLGSMIPLGAALEASGGTQLLANGLLDLTAGWPAWAVLTVLMVVTMTLSDVLNNTATAIVAAPVGIAMAESLGVSPDPFLMAVAVAASAAFLTPIGHKNNTLILGPGGYRFGDYWRMGLPLEALIIAVSVPMLLLVWPL